MLVLLYLMAYLDKTNIGNAKIEGLVEDLNMKGIEYNVAVAIFFIPFILCGKLTLFRRDSLTAMPNHFSRGSIEYDPT